MTMSRRGFMVTAGLASTIPVQAWATSPDVSSPSASGSKPMTAFGGIQFTPMDVTYLDSGTMHPASVGARASLHAYMEYRARDPAAPHYDYSTEERVLGKFAKLINADADEVAYVQSTTAGEQLVVRSLGLPERGAHVVTDTFHFFGSFYLYEELAKQGVKVSWIRPRDNRIQLDDIEAAVTQGTRLVALSAVSTYNGFEHDLKKVCEIAHAKGALVYADIIHAAGCIPIDVKASNVDFAACASYKWLMGDFGLGFLYIRKDLQHKIRRPQFGYEQIIGSSFTTHVYPLDPPGATIADYAVRDSATGLVAMGTHSFGVRAMLDYSLSYLLEVGVPAIQAHAKPLTDRLKSELLRRGFHVVTPLDCTAPFVTCIVGDVTVLKSGLEAEKIQITIGHNRFRVTPSVFNTMDDIDRLLDVLGTKS